MDFTALGRLQRFHPFVLRANGNHPNAFIHQQRRRVREREATPNLPPASPGKVGNEPHCLLSDALGLAIRVNDNILEPKE